jgi:hypothetical protein
MQIRDVLSQVNRHVLFVCPKAVNILNRSIY